MKPLIYIALAAVLLHACNTPETTPENVPSTTATDSTTVVQELVKVVNVKAEKIIPSEFVSYYTVIGTVKANRDVILSAEASGRIVQYFKREGDRVKTGEVIGKIDDTLLRAEMERMQAMNRQAKENFERIGRLWNDEKVGSEMDYLNAKYAFEQSTASMSSMKEQLARTNLKAPFDGVVDDLIAEQGASVGMGSPVVRLIQDDVMKVTGGVPARFAGVVNAGQPVKIEVRNGTVLRYDGTVNFVSAAIDPKARTFRIEVMIPNNDHHLKVDAEASVTVETERVKEAMVLDQEFIGRNENGSIIYVVEEMDGKPVARARQVVLGPTSGNRTVILSGITPADLVITEGFTYVEDQIRIRLVQPGIVSTL